MRQRKPKSGDCRHRESISTNADHEAAVQRSSRTGTPLAGCRVSRKLRQQTSQCSGVLGSDAYRRRFRCNRFPKTNNSQGGAGALRDQDSRLCLCKRKLTRLATVQGILVRGVPVCTDIQLLDAPGVLQSRREEASTLQTLKALASSPLGFPRKPDQR